jgi:hypothetical protein
VANIKLRVFVIVPSHIGCYPQSPPFLRRTQQKLVVFQAG